MNTVHTKFDIVTRTMSQFELFSLDNFTSTNADAWGVPIREEKKLALDTSQ